MLSTEIKAKSIYYPPGGILLWGIIYLEIFTFSMALVALVYYSKEDPDLYHSSRMLLDTKLGTLNTFLLLVSGFFMTQTVQQFKKENTKKSSLYLLLTMLVGTLFLIVKGVEYYYKIDGGYTVWFNTFFTFYWLLTAFHVIHVIIGLIILSTIYFSLKNQKFPALIDVEASAAFWHTCDLIWLLLFPVLYLLL